MAEFNPQFQSPDQSFLGWSKPTGMPLADKSGAIATEALGKGIEGAVSLADTAVKGVIHDQLYQKIDKERDDFSDALTTVKNMAQGGNPLDANAQASNMDLMPDKPAAPPQAVNSGLTRIQNLQSAYNGNKLSETMYYQRLNSIAKDMRATYPGYRDYIDQEVSKITGGNPANEYLRSIIHDINTGAANQNKEYDYYEKQIINSGFDKSQQVLDRFKQDRDISYVQNWLAGNNERVSKLQQDKAGFEMSDKTRSDLAARAEITASRAAEHAATSYFFNRNLAPNDPTSRTSSQINDFLTDLSLHPEKRDPEAIRNLGTQLLGLKQRNLIETSSYLKGVKTKDGQSVYDILGPKKFNEIMTNTIGTLYDGLIQMTNDENLGLVHSTQNTVGDITNNKALSILKDPTIGGFTQTGTAVNKLMPNMSPDLYKEILKDYPNPGSQLLKANREQVKQIIGQTGGISNTAGGNVYTFNQAQGELDRMQGVTKEPDSTKAAAVNNILKAGTMALREKDPKIVDNAIAAFFDPSNRGSLNKFMDDYYDKARGVIVKGRTGAFSDLTDPSVTNNVWKRAHEGNGTAWEYYKGWARGEAVAGLTTMAQTWNLNEDKFAKQQFIHVAGQGELPTGTDHHFYWDTDKHQIGVTDVKGNVIDPETSWRFNPDLFAVRNANITLSRLKNIASTEGSNVDAFLFKTLKDAGWSPASVDQKGNARIDGNIMKAIILGHGGALQ